MNIADLVFLYAAQEKSISKAAARAFVSQQCASKHIQNLENRYGVPLLQRRPHFALTEPGQELFRALQQIYLLESGVAGRIAELSGGSTGAFTLGINASRARWLLPVVLREYRQLYPHVHISIRSEDTARLAQLLLQGEVDLIVGVNSQAEPRFHVTPLITESVYFAAAPQLLQRFLPDLSPQATALSLAQISRLPLCLNLPGSTLSEVLARCAAQHNIRLQCGVSTSDYGVQLALCLAGECGFFCPASLLQPVEAARSLRIFTVPELQEQLHIECIRTAAAVQPAYLKAFESVLLKLCRSEAVL